MSIFEKLKELIEAESEANTQWMYIADLEDELKEICNAAEELVEECNSYAYELDIDDYSASLTLSIEDVYCEMKTSDNKPFIKLIELSESVSVLPAEDGFFSINFRFQPVFEIN